MVEQSIYFLSDYFSSPKYIELEITQSVPHHDKTLGVPPEFYSGLIKMTALLVESTIPAGESEELAVWQEARDSILKLIENSS